MTRQPAAFLDRDGTIIRDAHYLADARLVTAVPGAADAMRRLHNAGVPIVVATNQSGIAQGLLSENQYQEIRRRVEALFAQEGTPIAGTWHCPHYPSISGPCDCRKPNTGMFLEAADRLGLDLSRSLFAGDRRRDVEPADAFGGFGVLVPSDETSEGDIRWAEAHGRIANSLEEAVVRFLAWINRA